MLRRILGQILNSRGLGVDGSINMIKNAVERDPEGNYLCTNLNSWKPTEKYNLIISMEVMYYLNNPKEFIKSLFHYSLRHRGIFIFGIDHYAENQASISWPKDLGVKMKTLTIDQWIDIFHHAGFKEVSYEKFNHKENWAGTLIINGIKNS